MGRSHPDAATLEGLAAGTLPLVEALRVTLHLSTCKRCRLELAAVAPASGQSVVGGIFQGRQEASPRPPAGREDEVLWSFFRRRLEALAARLEAERLEAPALLRELIAMPPERRKMVVLNSRRFQTVGLTEVLLLQSKLFWHEDTREAENLAELALEIISKLDEDVHTSEVLNDLAAEAWASIGNARRIRAEFRRVEEAFRAAGRCLERGSGSLLDRGLFLELEGSLRRDQGRFGEAVTLLNRAADLYRAISDVERQGRTLTTKGMVLHDADELEEAIAVLREAARILDESQDSPLRLYCRHNLTTYLLEAGRTAEAKRRLPSVKALALTHGRRLDLINLLWLEGQILEAEGNSGFAEASYRKARDRFLEEGHGFAAAFVSLDLTLLFLKQDRSAEARELAVEMVPVFEAADVHREAAAALLILAEALRKESATAAFVADIRSYLELARKNPALRFRLGKSG